MVGAEDDRAPPSDSEEILSHLARGRLVEFPGLSHVSLHSGDRELWLSTVLPFLDEVDHDGEAPRN